MNQSKIKLAFLLLAISSFIFACSSDDSGDSNNNSNSEQVENFVQSGTWRITRFVDSNQDETSDFNGYSFTFNDDGSLVASNGTNSITGTWSVMDDSSSSDDDSNDDDDFIIFFPVPDSSDFEDLNDDWDILSVSENKIELRDVSGGNGGTDLLTFEKN